MTEPHSKEGWNEHFGFTFRGHVNEHALCYAIVKKLSEENFFTSDAILEAQLQRWDIDETNQKEKDLHFIACLYLYFPSKDYQATFKYHGQHVPPGQILDYVKRCPLLSRCIASAPSEIQVTLTPFTCAESDVAMTTFHTLHQTSSRIKTLSAAEQKHLANPAGEHEQYALTQFSPNDQISNSMDVRRFEAHDEPFAKWEYMFNGTIRAPQLRRAQSVPVGDASIIFSHLALAALRDLPNT